MLIEKFADEFRHTKLRDWSDKIKLLTTAASIKDVKSIKEYLQVLQSAYGKLPKGQRESFLSKDERFEASFKACQLGPNNK